MLNTDLQKLEPGSKIRLIEVDGTQFNADVLRFHCDTLPYTPEELAAAGGDESKLPVKSIWWQGKEYFPWPFQLEGLDASTDTQAAEPKLTVGNIDGQITALCLQFNDMVKAKVYVHDTLVHYLDARNFPEGNPTADPHEEKLQTFFVDRKSAETNEAVEFELSSPADLRGQMIPTRQIHSLCTWAARGSYRSGNGCDYAGDRYFDEKGNPVNDPSLDRCGGLLSDCKKRFGDNEPLSFGGFPGSALIKQ